MSEQIPYNEDLLKQLNDLPLPNQDLAWENMRRRLEKDDDDASVIPPVLKGCGGYILLLVVLVIAILFIVDPAKWFHSKKSIEPDKTVVIENKNVKNTDSITHDKKLAINKRNDKMTSKDSAVKSRADIFNRKNVPVSKIVNRNMVDIKGIPEKRLWAGNNGPENLYIEGDKKNLKNNSLIHQNERHNLKYAGISHKNNHLYKTLERKTRGRLTSTVSHISQTDSIVIDTQSARQNEFLPSVKATDSSAIIVSRKKIVADSIKIKTADTTIYKKKTGLDSAKENHLHFSAGLAINQLLPVAGQKSNPYNSSGRKGSLGDYVPSFYLRMYKSEKWFIQSEFRYGAPQYAKQIVFNQKKIIDTGTSSVISTNSSIKKTFYHQLPVSFNYFVLPDFSIGAGITFNKFTAALVQEDVHVTNTITQTDSLVSTGLVNQKKPDSNFVTTYMQALFETQYRWRWFSIGARYSFGLQPYLKFRLPGGEERKERNSALQLFIRFEIWRSKKN